MHDFLKNVPDAAWAALVTGLILMAQNSLNNRRDKERRKEDAAERKVDREFQLQQSEKARAASRADAWREDRMNAHEALVTELRIAKRTITERVGRFSRAGEFNANRDYWSPILVDLDNRQALEDATARVEIVGSEAAKQLAVDTLDLIGSMDTEHWVLAVVYDETEGHETQRAEAMKKLTAMKTLLAKEIEAYIAAVRKDIGTGD